MNRRRVIRTIALVIVIILLGVFVIYGIPFIRDTFTPPIVGLPTAQSGAQPGNSLQARYTQTALARQSGSNSPGTATPAVTQ